MLFGLLANRNFMFSVFILDNLFFIYVVAQKEREITNRILAFNELCAIA